MNNDAAHWIRFAKTVAPGAPFSIEELACMAASCVDSFDDKKYEKSLNRNETRIRAGLLTPVGFIDVPGEVVFNTMLLRKLTLRDDSGSTYDARREARRANGGLTSPVDQAAKTPAKASLAPTFQNIRKVALVTRALMTPFWTEDTRDGLGGGAAEIVMSAAIKPRKFITAKQLEAHPDFLGLTITTPKNSKITASTFGDGCPSFLKDHRLRYKGPDDKGFDPEALLAVMADLGCTFEKEVVPLHSGAGLQLYLMGRPAKA